MTLIGCLLATLAVLVWPDPSALPAPSRSRATGAVPTRVRRAAVIGTGMIAAAWLVGASPWLLGAIGLVGALASRWLPVRPDPADLSARRVRLLLHADLLASALDAGMSAGGALTAVSSLLDRLPDDARPPHDPAGTGGHRGSGPRSKQRRGGAFVSDDGRRPTRGSGAPRTSPVDALRGVARLIELGASADEAWRIADPHAELAGLAAAARRCAVAGTPLAEAVREHAAALRAAGTAESERRTSRAGVAMTAPLTLCFLPAFVCLGLAPVVVGLLGTLGLH